MTAPERTNMKILDYLKERTLEELDRQEDALIEELHTGSYERDTEIYEEIDRVRAAMRALSLYDDEMTALEIIAHKVSVVVLGPFHLAVQLAQCTGHHQPVLV